MNAMVLPEILMNAFDIILSVHFSDNFRGSLSLLKDLNEVLLYLNYYCLYLLQF
jgi:hypothetical protein